VDAKNIKALVEAIRKDDGFYEEEALEKGLTVKRLKEIKRIEAENARLRVAQQDIERRQNTDRVYSQWMQQADAVKRFYLNFDFRAEEESPQFVSLLWAGIDVRTAYEVVHRDEILGGAMQYTA